MQCWSQHVEQLPLLQQGVYLETICQRLTCRASACRCDRSTGRARRSNAPRFKHKHSTDTGWGSTGQPQPAAEHFFTLTPCSLRLISPSEACQLTVFSISLAQVKSSNSGGQVCVVQYVKSAVTIGSWTTLDSRMVMLVFNGACVTNPL